MKNSVYALCSTQFSTNLFRSFIIALLFGLTSQSFASTKTWSYTGATGAWSTGSNWSGGVAPVNGDDVVIGGTATTTWNNIPSLTLNSLTINGSSNLSFSNAAVVTLTISKAGGGGTLSVSNNLNTGLNVSITIAASNTGSITSGKTLTLAGTSSKLTVAGTLTVNGSSNNALQSTVATITLQSGGLINFAGCAANGDDWSSGITVQSGGELRFSGSCTTSLGYVILQSGGLLTIGGTILTGNQTFITYSSGSTMQYSTTSGAQTANSFELQGQSSTNPYNIIINNSSGVTCSSLAPPGTISVTGTLTLTTGVFNIGNNSTVVKFTGATPIARNGTTQTGTIKGGTFTTIDFESGSGGFTIPNGTWNSGDIYTFTCNVGASNKLTMNNQNVRSFFLNQTSGLLVLGSGNFTVEDISGTYSASNMVVTSSTSGFLRYAFPSGATSLVTFPLGDIVGTTEYTRADITMNSNSAADTVGIAVVDASDPNLNTPGTPANYISRYWRTAISPSGNTYNYNLNLYYNGATGDVVGTEASMGPVQWDGSSTWNSLPGSVNTTSHYLGISAATQATGPFGNDITGRTAAGCSNPVISGNTPSNPTTCAGTNGSITLTGLTAVTVYAVTYNKNATPVSSANFTSNGSGNLVIGSLTSGAYNNFVVTISTCSSTAYPSSGSITLSDPTSPTAVISGTLGGCVSPGVSLGTTGSGAGSGTITGYQWSNSVGPIGGATGSTYTATVSDNYTVVIGNSNNCSATSTPGAVTVSANPTAVISGTLSGCVSPGVSLGTTGSGAGSGTIMGYQWNNSGGPISGATSSTYTATATDNYTVVITNSNGCSATSTPSTVTVNNCGPFTWTGGSGDWSTPSNWSPAAVPNSCGANVSIPSGAPVISMADINVGNITLGGGIQVTLNGRNLNVCDTFTGGSGTQAAVVGSGTTFINGSSAQTIIGNTQFDILQINNLNGVTLVPGAALSIATGLQLQHGQLDVSAGSLTLLSTAANNNSYIDDFSSTYNGTILGNIIAQRYIPVSGYNQHFISSPLARVGLSQINATGPDGTFVIPSGDCDETQSSPGSQYGSVFTYVDGHEPSGVCMLGNWKITTMGDMLDGTGYSAYVNGNSTVSVTGTINTGDISATNLNNSGYPTVNTLQGDPLQSGWNLVGNPYPSAINLTTDRTGSGFGNQVQVWQTSGPFAGSWQAYTIGVDANIIIPPFQGFMVRRTATNSGSYPFYQAERSRTVSQSFYRATATALELDLNYNGVTDITRIAFNPSATTGYDGAFDANKTDGKAGRPTLYTYFDNSEWYALNSVPLLTQTSTVPMGLRPEATGTMTLTPKGIESFDPTTYILLEDKQTGVWQNLRDGAYTFNTNTTDNQQRFVLHFTPPVQITTSDASCNMDGLIAVAQPGTAAWNYTLTDAGNNTVSSGVLDQYTPLSVSAPLGVYQLSLTDNDGYTVVKNIQVGGFQQVIASFTTNTTTTSVRQPVQFTNTSNSNLCTWYFGDGASATGTNVQHTYQNEGVYTVNLTVTNADGCTSIATQTVTVTSRSATGLNNVSSKNNIPIWSSDNRVFVDFTNQGNVDAQIDLYNVLGQLLSSEKFGGSAIYSRPIDNVEAAYIIVHVTNGNIIETKKVFIANTH